MKQSIWILAALTILLSACQDKGNEPEPTPPPQPTPEVEKVAAIDFCNQITACLTQQAVEQLMTGSGYVCHNKQYWFASQAALDAYLSFLSREDQTTTIAAAEAETIGVYYWTQTMMDKGSIRVIAEAYHIIVDAQQWRQTGDQWMAYTVYLHSQGNEDETPYWCETEDEALECATYNEWKAAMDTLAWQKAGYYAYTKDASHSMTYENAVEQEAASLEYRSMQWHLNYAFQVGENKYVQITYSENDEDYAAWDDVMYNASKYDYDYLLTQQEWTYLLTQRPNAALSWARATYTNSNKETQEGIFLFPDGLAKPACFTNRGSMSGFEDNIINSDQAKELFKYGVAFLPKAGKKVSGQITGTNTGAFWTSTEDPKDASKAFALVFTSAVDPSANLMSLSKTDQIIPCYFTCVDQPEQ